MKPGRYYIGDLYHVLANDSVNKDNYDWSDLCRTIDKGKKNKEGVFSLRKIKDSEREVAIFNTLAGNGELLDDNGYRYQVCSGTMGCILVSSIRKRMSEYEMSKVGKVVNVAKDFHPKSNSFYILLGDSIIYQ